MRRRLSVWAQYRVVVLCVWWHHPSGGAVVSTGYALQHINTKLNTNMILGKWPNVTHKFLSIYLFITLYMFRAHSAHHQERQILSIQPLVTIILCWWLSCVQVGSRVYFQLAHNSATNIEWLLPEAVLIQFVSPDDEHYVLETCREL